MNIILLGKPGAGKGYVSKHIENKYKLTHISTGDLCRKNINNKTTVGLQVEKFVKKGQLVPMNIILQMLRQELQVVKDGVIFDGFPRNEEQAKELDKIAKIDLVLFVDVPNQVILDRISKRRICSSCGKMFNIDEAVDETCPICGNKLVVRPDDDLQVAKDRLLVYEQQTKPLIDYYKNIIVSIDNSGCVDETFKAVDAVLDCKMQKRGDI